MAKSIIQTDCTKCFICGRNGAADHLEKHHIFGAADRKKSEKDGLTVYLCGDRCHRNGSGSAHRNSDTADTLKTLAQRAWMNRFGNGEDFMERYGENYL